MFCCPLASCREQGHSLVQVENLPSSVSHCRATLQSESEHQFCIAEEEEIGFFIWSYRLPQYTSSIGCGGNRICGTFLVGYAEQMNRFLLEFYGLGVKKSNSIIIVNTVVVVGHRASSFMQSHEHRYVLSGWEIREILWSFCERWMGVCL